MKKLISFLLITLMLSSIFISSAVAEENIVVQSPNEDDKTPQVVPTNGDDSSLKAFVESYTSQGTADYVDENGNIVGTASAWQYDEENSILYREVTITDKDYKANTQVGSILFTRSITSTSSVDGTETYRTDSWGVRTNLFYGEDHNANFIWKANSNNYDTSSWKNQNDISDIEINYDLNHVVETDKGTLQYYESNYFDDRDGKQVVFHYLIPADEESAYHWTGTHAAKSLLWMERAIKISIDQPWNTEEERGTYYLTTGDGENYLYNPEVGAPYWYLDVTYNEVLEGNYGPTAEELEAAWREANGETAETGETTDDSTETPTGDTPDSTSENAPTGTADDSSGAPSGDNTEKPAEETPEDNKDNNTGDNTDSPTDEKPGDKTEDSSEETPAEYPTEFPVYPPHEEESVYPELPSYPFAPVGEDIYYPNTVTTGMDITKPAQEDNTGFIVKGTLPDGTVVEANPADVVTDVDTALAELSVTDPSAAAELKEFFEEAQKSDDILAYGVVDFGDRFKDVEDDYILVPIFVKGLMRGQKVRVALSNGDEHILTCEQKEIVWVPFPKNAKNIGYAVFLIG